MTALLTQSGLLERPVPPFSVRVCDSPQITCPSDGAIALLPATSTQPVESSMAQTPSFSRERKARLASTPGRSQSMNTGILQRRGTGRPATPGSSGSIADQTRQPMVQPWLTNALEYVKQIDHEAQEEGYPPIGNVAKRNATHVLLIAASSPLEPEVYASMDGEIAVYFKSPAAPAALLILCDNNGGAGCYWSIHGKSDRRRHDDASELPVDFVHRQLRALGGEPLPQSLEPELPVNFVHRQFRALGGAPLSQSLE